ncbi:hypothetical protein H5410_037553 [Solanum commersonii]|uniref:Uncharacterized protein n=1 Tax=Solanum commersonii TaxID=4109 RepID=A0A9J5Y7H2_SOLCO|nr:hypothetical protein H5410_037553 [Solanum commersonii]
MTERFKRLNQTIEKLEKEKERMAQHIHFLQEKIKTLPLQIKDHQEESKSSPSQMDKTSVHSSTNVEIAIVSARGTTSPAQMVAGKDSSNLLMADTLPKNVMILPAKPESADFDPEDTESRSDENDLSIDQFTQHYDPNEDNDSGMSFDFEALHNLDT